MIEKINHPLINKPVKVTDLRRVFYSVPDEVTGTEALVEFVEFNVNGEGRNWPGFLKLSEFRTANPTLNMDAIPQE